MRDSASGGRAGVIDYSKVAVWQEGGSTVRKKVVVVRQKAMYSLELHRKQRKRVRIATPSDLPD